MKDNEGKLKWLHVRLSNKEYEILHLKFKQSTCRKLSDYARKMLLGKPVIVFTRNQSLDEFVVELLKLKTELNALGNNYNQVVKRLHTTYDYGELKLWLKMHESSHQFLISKMEEIRLKMNQINDKWLQ